MNMGAPGSVSVCKDSKISCCLAWEDDASIVFESEVRDKVMSSVCAAIRCGFAARGRESPRANGSGYATIICTASAKTFAGLSCLKIGSCKCKGASGAREDLKGEGSVQTDGTTIKEAAHKDEGPGAMSITGAPHVQQEL